MPTRRPSGQQLIIHGLNLPALKERNAGESNRHGLLRGRKPVLKTGRATRPTHSGQSAVLLVARAVFHRCRPPPHFRIAAGVSLFVSLQEK